MSTSVAKCSILLILSFMLLYQSGLATKSSFRESKPCKRLVLYYHDILFNGTDASNATSATVANETRLGRPHHFGMLVVFNDPLTKDQHLLSPAVGRAQGFYFYDMKDDSTSWFAYSNLVFNTSTRSSEHKGALNIMGKI